MDIYEFSFLVFAFVITMAFIASRIRQKSPRFRLIKTDYPHGYPTYAPQVRIGGIWLYISSHEPNYLSFTKRSDFLDPHDAISLIDSCKMHGKLVIPSNKKLSYNEKEITVE